MEGKSRRLPGVSRARITPIQVPPEFIYRRELLEQIDNPAPYSIVAVAPSGFGKSVLLAQWAAQRPEITAWYTADKGDSAKDILFHVISSLRNNFPDFAPWAEEIIEKDIDLKEVAIRFSNSVAELQTEVSFAFDNMDAINGHEQVLLRNYWATNTPRNVKTFSTMRSSPAADYSRASNLGIIKYFSPQELKFNHSEISALCSTLNIDISESEVRKILFSAEGWPAGTNFICNYLAKSGKQFSVDLALTGTDSLILENSLASLDSEKIKVLESICFLDEIDSHAVEILSDGLASEQTLVQMALDGLFLSKSFEEENTYMMNSLVRQHLQNKLGKDPAALQVLLMKSADLIAESDPYQAFDLYTKAGETEKARDLALKNLRSLIFSGNRSAINRFENSLAPTLGFGPERVILLRTFMEVCSGDFGKALISLLEYESTFGGEPNRINDEGDIQIIRTRIDFLRGNFDSTIKRALTVRNLEVLKDDFAHVRILSTLQQAMGAAFLLEDYPNTLEIFKEAQALPATKDFAVNGLYLPPMRAMLALANGDLATAREYALLTIKNATKYHSAGLFVPFDAAYVLADVYRENGDFEKAVEVLDKYINIALSSEINPWLVALISKRALVYSHMGQTTKALNEISMARELVPSPRFGSDIVRVIDEHELLIRVSLGDEERIKEILFRMPKTATTIAFLNAYAAMQSPTKADQIMSTYKAENPRTKINLLFVGVQIYKKTNPRQSMQYLKEAVNVASEYGFFQVFLQQREEAQYMMLELAGKYPTVYLERLASALRKQMKAVIASTSSSNGALTKRELDILRRLSTGLPIPQIASGLHISNNTIKTHLKSVYKKMGVDSRHTAVAKAKELQLL